MGGMRAASARSLTEASAIAGEVSELGVAIWPADCSGEGNDFSTGGVVRGTWRNPQPQVRWLSIVRSDVVLAFDLDAGEAGCWQQVLSRGAECDFRRNSPTWAMHPGHW